MQIWCRGNGNTIIPTNFAWNKEEVIFNNYTVPNNVLTAEHIKESNETRWLTLRKIGIERIETGIFSVLRNLEVLRISENNLKELNENTFEGLNKLWDLSLRNNLLEKIDGCFTNLSSLKVLDLTFNKLSRITNMTFVGIDQVSYISLDSNEISSIEAGAFDHMTSVTQLVLSNNPLNNVTLMSLPQSVVKLNLSQVGIDKIPSFPIPRNSVSIIYQLILSYNNIVEITQNDIDKLAEHYPVVQVLNFGHNRIQHIESDSFRSLSSSLFDLVLNYNMLRSIPSGLPYFLRYLILSHNKISTLGDNNLKNSSLIILSLNNNQIREISICSFCGLFQLRHLNLQNNKIEVLNRDIFLNLTSLLFLEISNNRIKKLEIGCFYGLEKLRRLELSHISDEVQYDEEVLLPLRNLKSIFISHSPKLARSLLNPEILFKYLHGIIFLDISHNNLVTIHRNISMLLTYLRNVDLSYNNWHCSKSMMWLTEWMNSPRFIFQNREHVVCSHPSRLKGKLIQELKERDFETIKKSDDVESIRNYTISDQTQYRVHPDQYYQPESLVSVSMIILYSLLPGLLLIIGIIMASGPLRILKNRFRSFRKVDLNVFCEFKEDSVQTALISENGSNDTISRNLLDSEDNFSFYTTHL